MGISNMSTYSLSVSYLRVVSGQFSELTDSLDVRLSLLLPDDVIFFTIF